MASPWFSCLTLAVLAGTLLLGAPGATAQTPTARLTVRVTVQERPTEGVRVTVRDTAGLTNEAGEVVFRLGPGDVTVRAERQGLEAVEQPLTLRANVDTVLVLAMHETVLEHEAIVVRTTRADRRVEDEPLRVEVVGREEIEEKLLMTPGDIAMLLNETSGLRVQPTAPSLGGASVRIQGLRGRYTHLLSDGLPLYGGQTGALGPLQIPPMDLGQVEVIKGAASALYGASALGGVVNLISRRPADTHERELLLNASTLGGADAILWTSGPLAATWGYTLLASGHRQAVADVNDDGWADVPSFRRALVRPRLFRERAGHSTLFTIGAMVEDREGGTVDDATTPDGVRVSESLDTRRIDAGLVHRSLLAGSRILHVRAAGTVQRHEHGFAGTTEADRHSTAFVEFSLAGTRGAHTWVVGTALQHERYDADDVTGFDYDHTVTGFFVQDEYTASDWLSVSASARVDHHNEYGSFVSPRVSLLLRPADEWTVRASAGTGFFAPTPWIEETESIGLGRVASWPRLDAERARSASLDIGRTIGPVEINATVFTSSIRSPVQARAAPLDSTRIVLFNAESSVSTHGTELLVRYHREGLHITATHVYLRSTEPDPTRPQRREVPLSPSHAAGLVAAWENEGRSRIGFELYYTGRQTLDDNPYRDKARSHVITGLLGEVRIGRARLFLNAENLLDTRQTRYDPLLLPTRSANGRWITDVWAPLDGRTFNGGVRLAL